MFRLPHRVELLLPQATITNTSASGIDSSRPKANYIFRPEDMPPRLPMDDFI